MPFGAAAPKNWRKKKRREKKISVSTRGELSTNNSHTTTKRKKEYLSKKKEMGEPESKREKEKFEGRDMKRQRNRREYGKHLRIQLRGTSFHQKPSIYILKAFAEWQ